MYSGPEHRAKLQKDAQNLLFEAEFQKEVERQIAARQATSGKSLVERLGIQEKVEPTNKRFVIEGDDEHQSLMWKSLLKDCAFYYDVPTIQDEDKMRSTLMRKYDGVLPRGWRAPLTTRRDLLTWACSQLNSSFQEKGFPETELLQCDNYNALVKNFGPDYDRLKPKLGYIRGLFD